jgi:SAM-dependent methyltransferase
MMKFLKRRQASVSELTPNKVEVLTEAEMEQQYGPRIIRTIAPNDEMYTGDLQIYLRVAYSALRFTQLSLLAANRPAPKSILDFPSGHGRVLRVLKAAFPDAALAAVDINADAVDFCGATFGAKTGYSTPDPEQIRIADRFDLIFCGSLLTHLDAPRWPGFLKMFHSLLSPGGILVFSTHGEVTRERIKRGEHSFYAVSETAAQQLVADYLQTGFGYADYSPDSNYGVSLSSLAWVQEQLANIEGLQLVACLPRQWLEHHDVWACQNIQSSKE